MDYIDQLKQFSTRVAQLSQVITTEEATKTALILPFFQMLGYDVFNPMEFVPEYTADVGIKKGEKVDYAIVIDGEPVILIEAKWCGEPLESHDSQLFRYFATSTAKIAILTNGVLYRFYTDLDEPNKMDLVPFMEFNILDIKENLVPELKRFQRNALDVENISSAASDLRYMTAVKRLLTSQASDPDEAFLSYVIREVYAGRKTAQVVEKFKGIVKRAFAQYINDIMNERLKSVLSPEKERAEDEKPSDVEAEAFDNDNGITTTDDELEAFIIVKTLLHSDVDVSRLQFKDTRSYFVILLDGKTSKWICRLFLEGRKHSIVIPCSNGTEERFYLENNDDIYKHQEAIRLRLKTLL